MCCYANTMRPLVALVVLSLLPVLAFDAAAVAAVSWDLMPPLLRLLPGTWCRYGCLCFGPLVLLRPRPPQLLLVFAAVAARPH